jgi:hypothetical protein
MGRLVGSDHRARLRCRTDYGQPFHNPVREGCRQTTQDVRRRYLLELARRGIAGAYALGTLWGRRHSGIINFHFSTCATAWVIHCADMLGRTMEATQH